MIGSYVTTLPALDRPASDKTVAVPVLLGRPHDQPIDPARVSPVHLPALSRVASDLDAVTAPVKVVAPTVLEPCTDCGTHGDGAMPPQTSIATVVAADTDGFVYRSEACALHLESLVRWHHLRGCWVHVEVPADSTRWYERDSRETWYAVDDQVGVVVARDVHDTWTVWLHDTNHPPVPLVARMGMRDGESWAGLRGRAEMLAQAVASQLAADAYEAASVAVTVALPVVAVSEAAA